MVKIGREKTRPKTLVSAASVRGRTLADKVYWMCFKVPPNLGVLRILGASKLFESYWIDVFCIVFYIYSCDFNNIAIP